ncbi:hypothetical protein FF124_14200 [Martelella lutilitoris]|uniref:Uncharacterized protein n=1 Tax=Martelella lutilitoris TaxID=2583532 RepID=A0A5C4JPV8_9HYPH|nr:hypothetical protein [Martelella lutilitoris]TNB47317.1 hypothetical protein FF124_14200 [Martelella lutilitoris]
MYSVRKIGKDASAKHWIEIWKKTVDVQQHFNDIELRIRNYAVIVVGALLGLGGYALRLNIGILLFGAEVSVSGIIVLASILPIFAFYFMDRFWYHRLLVGSVNAGVIIERKLKRIGYSVSLGTEISSASPFRWRFWGKNTGTTPWYKFPLREMHTKDKMDLFYLSMIAAVLVIGVTLLFSPPERFEKPEVEKEEQLVRTELQSDSLNSYCAATPVPPPCIPPKNPYKPLIQRSGLQAGG